MRDTVSFWICQHLLLHLAVLIGAVKWYLIVILIWYFLMAKMLNILVIAIYISSDEMSFHVFCLFSSWIKFFTVEVGQIYMFYLLISPLLETTNIFSQFVVLFLILLKGSFAKLKFLILMRSQFSSVTSQCLTLLLSLSNLMHSKPPVH